MHLPYDFWSSLTHLTAGAAGLIFAVPILWRFRNFPALLKPYSIYFGCITFLFLASGLYHHAWEGTLWRILFHRADHLAIITFFAATTGMMHILHFDGFWRWGFVKLLWLFVAVTAVIRMLYFDLLLGWPGLIFYSIMFSVCLITVVMILYRLGPIRTWPMLLGGVWLVVAAYMERLKIPVIIPGEFASHEFFHIQVALAIFLQWFYVSGQWRHLAQREGISVEELLEVPSPSVRVTN